jgi:hypothetical protein
MMKRLSWAVAGLALLLGGAGQARAELVEASTHLTDGVLSNFNRATGWAFTPTQDLVVSALGFWDERGTGLAEAHDVGLFLRDGTPVATTTIQAGTGSELFGQSRYGAITPVTLTTGTQYYLLANNFLIDRYVFGQGAVDYAPEVTWQGFVDGTTNSIFSAPLFNGGLPGDLGPNFLFERTSVAPEPGTLTLLGLGALGLLGYGWRQKRAAS